MTFFGYTIGDWTEFVKAAYITADEFKTITGQDYPTQRPAA
ncbi:XkdX family protein [Loigolactobacillus coryniformis subsp. coryniformis]